MPVPNWSLIIGQLDIFFTERLKLDLAQNGFDTEFWTLPYRAIKVYSFIEKLVMKEGNSIYKQEVSR